VVKRWLSVLDVVATVCIRMALDILVVGKFKGFCVEIVDAAFHREGLEVFLQISHFSDVLHMID